MVKDCEKCCLNCHNYDFLAYEEDGEYHSYFGCRLGHDIVRHINDEYFDYGKECCDDWTNSIYIGKNHERRKLC